MKRAREDVKKLPFNCEECRTVRTKCDKSFPACRRCVRKGLICTGFTTKPRRGRPRVSAASKNTRKAAKQIFNTMKNTLAKYNLVDNLEDKVSAAAAVSATDHATITAAAALTLLTEVATSSASSTSSFSSSSASVSTAPIPARYDVNELLMPVPLPIITYHHVPTTSSSSSYSSSSPASSSLPTTLAAPLPLSLQSNVQSSVEMSEMSSSAPSSLPATLAGWHEHNSLVHSHLPPSLQKIVQNRIEMLNGGIPVLGKPMLNNSK